MDPLRLLAVQHEQEAPPGWLGDWWSARGVAVDVVRGDLGEAVPARLDPVRHAGLVVLGGYMGACDDADVPWLAPTRELIRATVADGIPLLGVCLGHQLAAVALGGEVRRNPAGRALGLLSVSLTDAGRDDPLLGGSDGSPAIHFNEDIVTMPPPGSTVLASAPDGSVQALRFADRAWGVQFHPEVSPEIFTTWLDGENGAGRSGPAEAARLAARAEVAAAAQRLQAAWQPFAERFVTVLRG